MKTELIRRAIAIALLVALVSITGIWIPSAFAAESPPVIAVNIGDEPEGVALNPVTNMIYVVNENEAEPPEVENETIANNESALENETAAGNESANETESGDNGTVTVVDGANNRIVTRIDISSDSEYLAVNPVTNLIYVSNRPTHEVTVINGKTNTIITTIPIANETGIVQEPEGVAIDSVQNLIYVGAKAPEVNQICDTNETAAGNESASEECGEESTQGGSIYVIDGTTNQVIKSIPAGDDPESTVFNPVSHKVYTANEDDQTVTIANAVYRTHNGYAGGDVIATVTPFSNICVGPPSSQELDEYGEADKMAVNINPVMNMVYITDDQHRIAEIDGETNEVKGVLAITYPTNNWECSLGEEGPNLANNIAVNPSNNLIYVTSEDSRIALVDAATFTIQSTITVPDTTHLDAIAINPDTNNVYITDEEEGTLNVLQGECAIGTVPCTTETQVPVPEYNTLVFPVASVVGLIILLKRRGNW